MKNYTIEEYKNALTIVKAFEKEELRLSKFKGSTTCPFCNGSKTTPFLKRLKSQECDMCDTDGNITNRKLASLDLL